MEGVKTSFRENTTVRGRAWYNFLDAPVFNLDVTVWGDRSRREWNTTVLEGEHHSLGRGTPQSWKGLPKVYSLYWAAVFEGRHQRRCQTDLTRTSIRDKYPGSTKITTHLDHIGQCKTASGTNWSKRWTYQSKILAAIRSTPFCTLAWYVPMWRCRWHVRNQEQFYSTTPTPKSYFHVA